MLGGNGGALPAMFIPLAYGNLFVYEMIANEKGERQSVAISHDSVNHDQDIILIVDESVRGDYLDLNSSYGVKSGLADELDGINVINYGIAASISSCSSGVNVSLRYGGTRSTSSGIPFRVRNSLYINSVGSFLLRFILSRR